MAAILNLINHSPWVYFGCFCCHGVEEQVKEKDFFLALQQQLRSVSLASHEAQVAN